MVRLTEVDWGALKDQKLFQFNYADKNHDVAEEPSFDARSANGAKVQNSANEDFKAQ